jgi:hypothetical protein
MPDEVIAVIAMGGWIGIAVIWIVCHYTFLCWKQWNATSLIRGMMERGYTPQEITQLMEVFGHQRKSRKEWPDVPPAKPIKQSAYAANY